MDYCYDGESVFDYLAGAEYDGLILDIMMPIMDGMSVLKKLRSQGNQIPVLLLTAKDKIEERVKGLDAGANDYLVKPFAFEELLARVRVLVRGASKIQNIDDGQETKLIHTVRGAGYVLKVED